MSQIRLLTSSLGLFESTVSRKDLKDSLRPFKHHRDAPDAIPIVEAAHLRLYALWLRSANQASGPLLSHRTFFFNRGRLFVLFLPLVRIRCQIFCLGVSHQRPSNTPLLHYDLPFMRLSTKAFLIVLSLHIALYSFT